MIKSCKGCRYRSHLGILGRGCAYLLYTGRSRLGQMTPEQRKAGECPVRMEGILPVRIVRPKVHAYDIDKIPSNGPAKMRKMLYDSDQMLTLYDQGKSDGEIAEAVGCAKDTVQKWRRRKCLTPNVNPPRRPIDYEMVRRLYMAGLTDREIAETLGCGRNSIYEWRAGNLLPFNRKRKEKTDDPEGSQVQILRQADPVCGVGGEADPHRKPVHAVQKENRGRRQSAGALYQRGDEDPVHGAAGGAGE